MRHELCWVSRVTDGLSAIGQNAGVNFITGFVKTVTPK
jgi:hypothetical protein